ncbi:hypothetical protein IID21_04815 [Patescibacteria group bacterium]|nr:hypothetical protein [Patescibacteria group bacterium]
MGTIPQKESSYQGPPQKKPETIRNRKIFEKYSTGWYSYNTLSRVFKISPQRVGEVYRGVVEEIVKKYDSGKFSFKSLAKIYHVSPSKIEKLIKNAKINEKSKN